MYYVYILFSQKDKKLYTGYSDDLRSRYKKHSNGLVLSTKNRRPLDLIYYESYLSEKDAKQREKYLKGGKGKSELKVQLRSTFEKVDYQTD